MNSRESGNSEAVYEEITHPKVRTPTRSGAAPRALALTILSHPDQSRVGDLAWVDDTCLLSRGEPEFGHPLGGPSCSLGDTHISRTPCTVALVNSGQAVVVLAQQHRSALLVNGQPLTETIRFDSHELDHGVVIELAGRVALLLHRRLPPIEHSTLDVVGDSDAMNQALSEIEAVADLDLPVLLRGASGVGKELIARALHRGGWRVRHPFVPVNMGAIPTTVAASQLFGHVRGAFTGADRNRDGFFVEAGEGTLFLDEIGEAPIEIQTMLLRTLEEREVRPVGAAGTRSIHCRIVAATDADLEDAVSREHFRAALLHRLSGYEIRIPPLKERRDDIARLAVHFLREELGRLGLLDRLHASAPDKPLWFPPSAARRLVMHDWPGNVRELRNVIRRIAIRYQNVDTVDIDQVLGRVQSGTIDSIAPRPPRAPLALGQSELIIALERNSWRTTATAKSLGVSRTTLYSLMARFDIRAAKDVKREEIELFDSSMTVDQMSRELRVSRRGLQLRMKELGMRRD